MGLLRQLQTKAVFAILVTLAVAVLTACGRGDSEEQDSGAVGVTDEEVVLGASTSYSGPVSALAVVTKAQEAVFKEVNEQGGVEMADGKKRKIKFVTYDDGFNPARTLENARRLVESDEIFGMVGTVGSAGNAAIVEYMNQQETPHLYFQASPKLGDDVAATPWTVGLLPPYGLESVIYTNFLKEEYPNSKAVMLLQNDTAGEDYLEGVEVGLEGSSITLDKIARFETTDPTVAPRVASLAREDADIFFDYASPKFAVQAITKAAEVGFKVPQFVPSVSNSIAAVFKPAGFEAADGIYSASWLKDASDPRWADDEAVISYKEVLEKHTSGVDYTDALAVLGFTIGEVTVEALKRAEPSRQGFIDSVRNMEDVRTGLMLPGISYTTSPEDPYPIESMQLQQFRGDRWEPVGPIQRFEGDPPV